jgi:superfamily II DNA helicase RecQ
MRQLILEGLIRKDIEEYGVLKFTKKGEAFLKKPASFKIVLNNLFEEANADDEEGEGGNNASAAADDKLFEMLKDLRKQYAKEKNLPPFVLFQDPSLEDMATQYPTTLDECWHAPVVGSIYDEELDRLRGHVHAHGQLRRVDLDLHPEARHHVRAADTGHDRDVEGHRPSAGA